MKKNKMEGFKKGFYTTSQKKERKPEVNLGQSSLTQLQPSSQQIKQPGIQQNQEKWNQTQKDTHALTPLSEEKPRKQVKSVLHQEVSEFNPSGQMNMEQLIKVVLNLQEEVKKLHKENVKLTELIQHGLQDELDLRMANQERELDALWNYQRDQNSQTRSQMQQIQNQNSQMELIFASQRQPEQKMEIEELTQDQTNIKSSEKQNRIKRKCFYCFTSGHKFKQCEKFHQFKRNYSIKEKKEREKLFCNQEGEIYRIKENQKFKRLRRTRSKRRRLPDSEQDFSNLQTYFKRRQ